MDQPSVSSQPESVHNSRSAAPIIAGLLGALLVLETIGLGYVTMQLSKMKAAFVAGQQAQIPAVQDEVLPDGKGGGEGGGLSEIQGQISYDNEPYFYDGADELALTDLSAIIRHYPEEQGICKDVYIDVSKPEYKEKIDLMAKDLFGDQLPEYFLRTVERLPDGGWQILGYCKSGNERFLKLVNYPSGVGQIGEWVEEESHSYLLTYQPFHHMDGYNFYPNLINDEDVVGTGYSDAGYMDWAYYVLTPPRNTMLIEACSDAPAAENPEVGGYVERRRECSVQYVK